MSGIPGFRGMGLKELGKRLWHEFNDDNLTGKAAELAYYFLFALFPLLFFLVALMAYLPLGGAANALIDRLRGVMPPEAMALIRQHLNTLIGQSHPRLLSFGLLFTIWTVSNGIDSLRDGLNRAYDVKESRSYWKVQLRAIIMSVLSMVLVPVAIGVFILGSKLGFWLAAELGLSEVWAAALHWTRWPVIVLIIMLASAMCYYFLPDVRQRFKFITPGSLIATAIWLLATWGFSFYVLHFGTYNVTYGSIGGVIVLMTWLYFSALILLLGGTINAIHRAPRLEKVHNNGQPFPDGKIRTGRPVGS